MSIYRDQVAGALAAVAIKGPLDYVWLGRRSRAVQAAVRDALDQPARRRYLLARLGEELYWSFYCRGQIGPARWGEPGPVSADAPLSRAIAAANTGRGGWQRGWTVERAGAEEAVVTSARLRARVPVRACRGALAPGGAVSLSLPPELPGWSPGFVTVVGDAGDDAERGVLRVYWHVTARGAAPLVHALTSRLNAETVAFRLKVADHPLRFDRCDAAVLYLRADDFPALRPWLESVARELAGFLRPRVPAFTLPLAPGAGLAEDDDSGGSFGARRCGLLAEGILDAHEQRARGAARVMAVAGRFARESVEIDAPYLEPALAGRHVLA